MLNRLQFFLNYLIYFFTAGTAHSVHSPFVYDLVTRVINARRNKPVYHGFELIRSRMLKSSAELELKPLGAGKRSGSVRLGELVRRTAKSARYAELLERICSYFRPVNAIEIGTSTGISTLYQAAGMPDGILYTLEGNPDSMKVARHNFEECGVINIVPVEGLFDETLPELLDTLPSVDYVFFDGNHTLEATLRYFELCLRKAHPGSVFIFDDIRWSDEMLLAWNRIKSHPSVTVSIDLYSMGMVFFRQGQEKEDFTIRF